MHYYERGQGGWLGALPFLGSPGPAEMALDVLNLFLIKGKAPACVRDEAGRRQRARSLATAKWEVCSPPRQQAAASLPLLGSAVPASPPAPPALVGGPFSSSHQPLGKASRGLGLQSEGSDGGASPAPSRLHCVMGSQPRPRPSVFWPLKWAQE